ncbi:MAG: hypothetical protein OXI30_19920 [Chloroflexota bacterium]|nr:hypothetical protein [Chloroflexota bacterium]
MFLEFPTPDVFNAIIVVNIVLGLAIAGRRFRRDISSPLPDDAPQSAQDAFNAGQSSRSPFIDS